MRIAIVCDYFLDYVGGAQTSIDAQRDALREAGHEVLLLAPERRDPTPGSPRPDIRLTALGALPGLDLPVVPNTAKLRRRLRFALAQVDVVHVQTEFGLAHAATDVARELGIPVVHTVHTFYWATDAPAQGPLAAASAPLLRALTGHPLPTESLSPKPMESVLRNLTLGMARRADLVLSPSAHQASDLRAAGVEASVEVVPNPSPSVVAVPAPLPACPRFLWVARCEPEKRPLEVARAAVAALERSPGAFTLSFAGGGSLLGELRELCDGRPELEVLGPVERDHVATLLDEASAFVLSSVGFDNQPMTVAESIGRGRGVLYCDARLTEGLTAAGYLSGPSVEELTESLLHLATDAAELERLAAAARASADAFSPRRYVERVTGLYQSFASA
ncbi:glycosyltransferase [Herbiconiux sp. SYSU D00978]|uniref:glycosyltransferase n=1 Tax=Herbiconiux sp. SYSU D00978 TaxID=2812562 RepID=UPI001A97655B|nr:glycosyltransferase [Herbiconiux sp. SYSU D00978]